MTLSELLLDAPGKKSLLLGNEAIVRGALEAGVGCVTCYPGTPSSEAPDAFYALAPEASYAFEYSVNEKVAMEVAGGATLAGVPTLVTMKHVGVNVAADPLMTLATIGTPGGLVVMSADDPGCHSSQNEQDNRLLARMAGLPCFEPATAQEAKDMTREALLASARWQQPVMLRTTTRVSHLRGPVEFGHLQPPHTRGSFRKDPFRFVPLPAVARKRHPIQLDILKKIQEESEESVWNRCWGQGEIGIVVSGMARSYLRDALYDHGFTDSFRVLELGFSFPFPEEILLDFLKGLKTVLVLEELEPFVEDTVRILCQKHGLDCRIKGKDQVLTRIGEYSTDLVGRALCSLKGQPPKETELCAQEPDLPGRPPNLCPGCSHRAVYYAARKVFGDQAISSSDIGCYTLGFLPPFKAADFLFCMGSSISGGTGVSRVQDQPVIAYIGDSTFFHSGITGLINALHNGHDILVVILDNKTTAMTGHQPHPGVEQSRHGPNPRRVDIEQVVRGCGVEQIRKIKPLNLKKSLEAFEEFKNMSGVRVIIAEEPCVLFARRTLKSEKSMCAYVSEQTPEVQTCLEELACPAFSVQDQVVQIDEGLCSGCMFCVQICGSIKSRKRSSS
ncbi:MAG: indolepyruvate ferredoxin oxidoreductase subunit alpha [Desulfohalobiaceae bacterium]|nr:indolepyruvate ferredoxin oxidoreductase subunit alpha [Desulfohalobiaceae bacterium]